MEQVEEDIKELSEDVKKIDCNPICKFLLDCIRCIKDTIKCWF